MSDLYFDCQPVGCSDGYYEQSGDIPGWSSVDDMGGGQTVAYCDDCAAKCTSTPNCKSYECSHIELKCNLNSAADPTRAAYGDYDFCTKGLGMSIYTATSNKFAHRYYMNDQQ